MTIRVLVADDHAMVRDGLCALLEAHGDLEVVAQAGNGSDAVRQATASTPDVVLMDIAMPELNGIDACARIREACPRTRCVILSMHATSEHLHRALRAGATGYLMKESAGHQLADAVRAVHAGRTYLDESLPRDLVLQFRDRSPGSRTPLERLTQRKREIVQLVAEGLSSARIAERLFLSPKTVDTYRSRLMAKLGVTDLPSLVKFALHHGLTPPG